MSTQVAMSAQVDVVKKSYLKLKVFKSKNGGSCSAGLQGVRNYHLIHSALYASSCPVSPLCPCVNPRKTRSSGIDVVVARM